MIIRNEMLSDIAAISEVTIAAFRTLAISNHTEQFIINALRADNALTIPRGIVEFHKGFWATS